MPCSGHLMAQIFPKTPWWSTLDLITCPRLAATLFVPLLHNSGLAMALELKYGVFCGGSVSESSTKAEESDARSGDGLRGRSGALIASSTTYSSTSTLVFGNYGTRQAWGRLPRERAHNCKRESGTSPRTEAVHHYCTVFATTKTTRT